MRNATVVNGPGELPSEAMLGNAPQQLVATVIEFVRRNANYKPIVKYLREISKRLDKINDDYLEGFVSGDEPKLRRDWNRLAAYVNAGIKQVECNCDWLSKVGDDPADVKEAKLYAKLSDVMHTHVTARSCVFASRASSWAKSLELDMAAMNLSDWADHIDLMHLLAEGARYKKLRDAFGMDTSSREEIPMSVWNAYYNDKLTR